MRTKTRRRLGVMLSVVMVVLLLFVPSAYADAEDAATEWADDDENWAYDIYDYFVGLW